MASSGIAIRGARITDRSFVGEYDRCHALGRTQRVQNCIPILWECSSRRSASQEDAERPERHTTQSVAR
ncbi:hypothetical protein CXB37_16855 [Pseudomonas syringae pv. syringae]|nr:hypothetical protein CXB37_16855 [Pseudomonas syringae pv. syringae]